MIDVEPLIVSSFERIFPQPEAKPDWNEVLSRAGVRNHRYLVAVAAVVALVLAPAAWAIAQALDGKPAPPSVKSDFQNWNKMSATMAKTLARKMPTAIVSKAHGVIQVKTADGPVDLWAAPTKDGGTCYLVAWQSGLNRAHAYGSGGCYSATAKLNNAETSSHNLDWSSGGDAEHRNYNIVTGYTYGGATTVRIALSDGTTKTLPVIEGLFLGALHQSAHWRLRPKIVSVTARNAHGRIVGYWRRPARS